MYTATDRCVSNIAEMKYIRARKQITTITVTFESSDGWPFIGCIFKPSEM